MHVCICLSYRQCQCHTLDFVVANPNDDTYEQPLPVAVIVVIIIPERQSQQCVFKHGLELCKLDIDSVGV